VNRRNISLGFLERVPLFVNLDKYEKLKLIDGLESKEYQKGDYIITEGEEGDNFYIIEEGSVHCLKSQEDPSQGEILVRTLSRGDHFGELALINNVKRSLSIKVFSDTCKVLALGREVFNRILGNIRKYLNKDYGGTFDK
jgi:cAMP-dependent protein kinase regulator